MSVNEHDDDVTQVNDAPNTEVQANEDPTEGGKWESPELTEREMAIARGEDPDGEPEETDEVDDAPQAKREPSEPDDEPEGEPEGKPWYRETDLQLARTYGLSEDDLKEFADEKEFAKATRLLHRVAGDQVSEPRTPKDNIDEAKKTDGIPEGLPREAFDEHGKIRPSYFKENDFDDETMVLVQSLRDEQDRREQSIKEMEQLKHQTNWLMNEMVQERQRQQEQMFHTALDALNPGFYGQSLDESGRLVPLSDVHQDRRQKILEEVHAIGESITRQAEKQGIAPEYPTWEVMVRRAQNNIYAEEVAAEEKKQRRDKIAEQSRKRRPVGYSTGRTKAGNAAVDPTDPSAIAAMPEIAKFFDNN